MRLRVSVINLGLQVEATHVFTSTFISKVVGLISDISTNLWPPLFYTVFERCKYSLPVPMKMLLIVSRDWMKNFNSPRHVTTISRSMGVYRIENFTLSSMHSSTTTDKFITSVGKMVALWHLIASRIFVHQHEKRCNPRGTWNVGRTGSKRF